MEYLILALAFTCPAVFGAAMATIANQLLAQYASSIKKTVFILGWCTGNGGILAANGFLFNLFEQLKATPWGSALVTLGYLAGFGVVIVLRQRAIESKYSNKKLLECFFLLYQGNAIDKNQLCADLNVTEDELAKLNSVIIQIFAQRSRKLFERRGVE